MTESSDDECGCGSAHNHAPNLFTDPARQRAYREFIMQVFRLACVTAPLSVEKTVSYVGMACIGICPNGRADMMITLRALLFELARLSCDLSGGAEPVFKVQVQCDDPNHDHAPGELEDGSSVGGPEGDFHTDILKAFFTASAAGDLEAAVRVGDAVAQEAKVRDRQPESYVVELIGNCLVSLAYTAQKASRVPPSVLFED